MKKEYPFKKFTPIKKHATTTNAEEQVMEHLWNSRKPS
jgi:hypothetical protein